MSEALRPGNQDAIGWAKKNGVRVTLEGYISNQRRSTVRKFEAYQYIDFSVRRRRRIIIDHGHDIFGVEGWFALSWHSNWGAPPELWYPIASLSLDDSDDQFDWLIIGPVHGSRVSIKPIRKLYSMMVHQVRNEATNGDV